MLNATMALQTARLSEYLATNELHEPLGSAAYATAPDQGFLCEDQRWVGVSVTSEDEWRAFCRAIERPQLADDPKFRTNRDRVRHREALGSLLQPVFRAKPQFYWMMVLTEAGVPCGYPMRFEELRHHPQVRQNQYLVDVETSGWGEVTTGGPPWRFSRTPASWTGTPMPGEHTGEILDELEQRKAAPVARQV
jgi:formyl-CoA transferase/CoA:oxalate CoA-transferase